MATLEGVAREELKLREIPHGTLSGYNHHGCRCAECKKAIAASKRARYKPVERKPRPRKPLDHGAYKYIRDKCRCAVCTEAHREKVKDYRHRAKMGKVEKRGKWARKVTPKPRSSITQEQLDRALYHLQDGCSYAEAGRTVKINPAVLKSYFPNFEGQGRLNMVEINSNPELKALHDEIWNMKLPE